MKAGKTMSVMEACNMTLVSHVIHTFNQEHLMLAVLATGASLFVVLMADWGKGLYMLLPFRAPGLSLTFDIRIMNHLSGRGLNIQRPYSKYGCQDAGQ